MKIEILSKEETTGDMAASHSVTRTTKIGIADWGKLGEFFDAAIPALRGADFILRQLWARWKKEEETLNQVSAHTPAKPAEVAVPQDEAATSASAQQVLPEV